MKSYKHQLLTTSALVGAASVVGGPALAEAMAPSISVSGYFAHDTHFASQDLEENRGTVSHFVDSEVFFNFGGELDNGLKIGGRAELEALQAGDQIDETRLDLSGAWGMGQARHVQLRPLRCLLVGGGSERGPRREFGHTDRMAELRRPRYRRRRFLPPADGIGLTPISRTTIRPSPTSRPASTASSSR